MPSPTIHLLTCIRNEGPFILEFVAHHLVLGVSRIFIAANDCNDGSMQLLRALDAAGYVSALYHSVTPGQIPQREGYAKLRATFGTDAADWVMMLDIDEFLNVHIGDHSVGALVTRAPAEADIIVLNAATFGNGDEPGWRPGPVTAMFLDRHATSHRVNGDVKTLTRNAGDYRSIHNHSLVNYQGAKPELTAMRADGTLFAITLDRPMWRQLRHLPVKDVRHDWAQYNHYAIKTRDTYRLRRMRGRGAGPSGEADTRHDEAYYVLRAEADFRDETILRYAPAVGEKMAEMLADPEIRRCHEVTLVRMAERLAALPRG